MFSSVKPTAPPASSCMPSGISEMAEDWLESDMDDISLQLTAFENGAPS